MRGSILSRHAWNLFPYVIGACVCLHLLFILHVTDKPTELYPGKNKIIKQIFVKETIPLQPLSTNNTTRDPIVETHVTNGLRKKCPSRVTVSRGYPKTHEGFLTLGISTVPRVNAFYLVNTLSSLISEMKEMDKKMCTIVVFMATYNSTWVEQTLKLIDNKFESSITSGLIQVILPKTGVYSDLTNITRRTYNDSIERVRWRSKQNVDVSLLFAYCANISKYYIHLEDDITAATNYISEIRTYINYVDNTKLYWFVLEFSILGFIGKLFRSSDLCIMSDYFYLFLEDKPCDLLFVDLKRIKTQPKHFKIRKSIFQHVGVSSSLEGKIQNLKDKSFKDKKVQNVLKPYSDRRPKVGQKQRDLTNRGIIAKPDNENPIATILTNMHEYLDFRAECAYIGHECVFWANVCPKGSYYRLLFDQPIQLYNVSILTGHPNERSDILINGTVTFGTETKCGATHLADFKNGKVEARVEKPQNVTCLQITLRESQETWLVISDILINKKL